PDVEHREQQMRLWRVRPTHARLVPAGCHDRLAGRARLTRRLGTGRYRRAAPRRARGGGPERGRTGDPEERPP
ncbi:MAG: hypothetical protein ACRDUV_14505, partial [Pseudonocardiaceae bacterium]